MSEAIMLAAIALLCFIPFALVASALAGHNAVAAVSRRLGLNHQAASDLNHVVAPLHATSSAVSGAGYVFFILGGIAGAAALGELYEKIFGLEGRGFLKSLPYKLAWLVALAAVAAAQSWYYPYLNTAGGYLLQALVGFVTATLFWWLSIWLLLAGREHWRAVFPCALATGICWTGMLVVFHFVFSNSVIGDYKKYGDVGVVFAFMSFFIAWGVVIILGAAFGLVWREARHPVGPDDGRDPIKGDPVAASPDGAQEVAVSNPTGGRRGTQEVR